MLFLTGCQGLTAADLVEDLRSPSVMPLWQQYRRCLADTDPDRLFQLVEEFEQVMLDDPEPPSWMNSWGQQVRRQPLRTAVDPQALGAACTIRTALVMAEQQRLDEASALYQRVISRYPRKDWAYYHEQAQEALASLTNSNSAVIVLRGAIGETRTR